jgi:hypothetical protein
MSEDTGVWTYAITEGGRLSWPNGEADLSLVAGVAGAPVRTIACSGLTVLVSDVSLAEFGEAALRRNLENLDWLDEVAREHHDVIDAATRIFPLLPTRLATVYSGDAAVCAALASRRDQLRDALHRVGGRVEWGVKGYAAPEPDAPAETDKAERAATAGNRDGPDAGGDAGTAPGAGLAYLNRRRAQLAADREAKVGAVHAAQAIHADLTARATDARLHPPQSGELSGVHLPMLLNAAYLVDAADGAAFTAAVAGQATAHPGLRVELTGPWPPYSFADDGDDDDKH